MGRADDGSHVTSSVGHVTGACVAACLLKPSPPPLGHCCSEGPGSRQVTPPPDSESNELLHILAEASSGSSSSSSDEEISMQDVEEFLLKVDQAVEEYEMWVM